MPEIFGSIILVLLIVVGVAAVIQWVKTKTLIPSEPVKSLLIIPINENQNEIEIILRSADYRARLYGEAFCYKIIAVDCGLDEESFKIYETACLNFDEIQMCKLEDLGEILKAECVNL